MALKFNPIQVRLQARRQPPAPIERQVSQMLREALNWVDVTVLKVRAVHLTAQPGIEHWMLDVFARMDMSLLCDAIDSAFSADVSLFSVTRADAHHYTISLLVDVGCTKQAS